MTALCWNPVSKEVSYSTSGTKTFVIDHPVDKDKFLIHACLEGPEAGVYYRGKDEIISDFVNIKLPQYAIYIAKDFTVQLTPIFDGKLDNTKLYCSEVINGEFKVFGPKCMFFWHVTGKRNEIKVEVKKDDVVVSGDGPYKYLL
jgi:hypothetical protein